MVGSVHPGTELQITSLNLSGLGGHVTHRPAVNIGLVEVVEVVKVVEVVVEVVET